MSEKHKILIVDDDQDTLDALKRVFWKDYDVLTALSAKEGLKLLVEKPVSVIICDQRMPEMTGAHMLEKSIALNPDAVRILITAYADIESIISAINEGKIYHFETKPWDSHRLKNIVEKGLKLKLAEVKLKTLDQAKTSFLNVISHALRTPLTTILGFTETLLEGKNLDSRLRGNDNTDKTALEYIHKAAQKLLRMAEDVILLTTLKTQTHKIKTENIDLKCVIEKTLSHFDTLIQKQKIQVTLAIPSLKIKGDPKLLESLFYHLIENALIYNEDKGTLKIESERIQKNVKILIENKTQNLSQKEFKNIFGDLNNPKDMKYHQGGLGLGLPLSGLIVKTLSGTLSFHKKDKTFQTVIIF
ncbi:MAG: response regulator [Deltaproteobacteria bacterium]|nr:response regulator [Deltaproteobacteria bacterium]